ncbi:Cold-shock DEAD box protein A [Porphyromonas cangingivalis]|uniref:DEAD-box ATP-dependent RNA helicase RhpA n=1 Tax=Porphyromonas cangingivalis TaxID=36874 RepID=A0A1T4JPM6_PORCN|nr:ATP-dependent RNA helicase DeaD [Porphyromonas cangingivalis]VEJ04578.1 Cold-shock DEAD box protein A [Porphyromonas cangingivalis]
MVAPFFSYTTKDFTHLKTFEALGISAPLCEAIKEMGFESPMPVQEAVIPHLLGGGIDIIALAQTGTGKTAAFGLPILQNIDTSKRYPQALILSPTRELCVQIAKDLANYSKYLDDLNVVAVYGGASIELQMKQISKGVQIVVATPGRLLDLVRRGALDLSKISDVVLDEADEMLNMGFSESIDEILKEIPQERHMLLFSATMPEEIARITRQYMHDPKEIVVGERNVTNKNIRHLYYMVSAKDRYLALKRIADYYPSIYGIIFCRTRRDTQEIADKLIQDGYNADALHGDLSQQQRDYVMQKFRVRNLQLLVATDVAARGLDVDNLTHVIQFGLPDDPESYTHRSGRTARAGKSGISISICHSREKGRLRDIAKLTGVEFERAHIPSGKEICEKQLYNFIDGLENTIPDDERIAPYINGVMNRLSWLDNEQLIRRVVYMELERLIKYYEDAEEIQEVSEKKERAVEREHKTREERRRGVAQKGFERLTINFGKRDKVYPNTLIDIINRCLGSFVEIGKIDIYESRAYFEVKKEDAFTVIDEMNSYDLGGRRIKVEIAKPEADRKESRGEYNRGKRDGKRKENRQFTSGFRREGKRKR